jgi:hypothetical protein
LIEDNVLDIEAAERVERDIDRLIERQAEKNRKAGSETRHTEEDSIIHQERQQLETLCAWFRHDVDQAERLELTMCELVGARRRRAAERWKQIEPLWAKLRRKGAIL